MLFLDANFLTKIFQTQHPTIEMPNKALCILTGASRGIGGAILEKLSHQGYSVIAISRGKTLQSTSLAVSETKNQIFHVPFDLGEVEKFNELEMVGLTAARFAAKYNLSKPSNVSNIISANMPPF